MEIYTQLSQVRVLFQKNVLTMKKGTLTLVVNCLILPFLAGFCTKFIEFSAITSLHPPITPIKGVERCSKSPASSSKCMNLAYSPDTDDEAKKIITKMANANKELEGGDELTRFGESVSALSQVNNDSQVYGFKDSWKTATKFFEDNPEKLSVQFYINFENSNINNLILDVFFFDDQGASYMLMLYQAIVEISKNTVTKKTKISYKEFAGVGRENIFWSSFRWLMQLFLIFFVSTHDEFFFV